MSCTLTRGRNEILCRNNIGGIKAVYLFKYIEYPYSSIVGATSGNIIDFPAIETFKYETTGATFTENITNDENGIFYDQTLTFNLIKSDLLTSVELDKIKNIELRYLVEYNAGYFKMGGVYNGAEIETFSINSGGNKSDFNGYNVTIKGREEYASPFFSTGLVDGFILLEDAFYLLLETSDKIMLD